MGKLALYLSLSFVHFIFPFLQCSPLFCAAQRNQRHQTFTPCIEDVHTSACVLGPFPSTGKIFYLLDQCCINITATRTVTQHVSLLEEPERGYRDSSINGSERKQESVALLETGFLW